MKCTRQVELTHTRTPTHALEVEKLNFELVSHQSQLPAVVVYQESTRLSMFYKGKIAVNTNVE